MSVVRNSHPEPGRGPLASLPDGLAVGVGVGLLLHIALLVPLVLLNVWMPIVLVGLAQLLWLGPLAVYFKRQRRPNSARGVWMLVGMTVLVNGGCVALFSGGIH